MATHVDEFEKLEADRGTVEHGYESWKRAKIERGLRQAQDRSSMIPVEQVVRDLKVFKSATRRAIARNQELIMECEVVIPTRGQI
ncbi:MAG: hypothetical protein EOP64_05460 [Sphingomonas sp.]|nr:MAG: hypothetical protein EOP64_05460 [Sphingomonas sp.]